MIGLIVLQVIAGIFIFMTLREVGHVLVARAFGDRQARFVVLGKHKGEWVLAATFTRYAQIEGWDGVAVALAGVGFTRMLAWPLGVLVAEDSVLRPLLLTVFVLCRTDFWLYTVRNFVSDQLLRRPQPGADISGALGAAASLMGVGEWLLFLALLGVTTLDLRLVWPRLQALFLP